MKAVIAPAPEPVLATPQIVDLEQAA
jgi:hypothetical protein